MDIRLTMWTNVWFDAILCHVLMVLAVVCNPF